MPDQLQGKWIAIIATDGVEQVELERPRAAAQEAGATVELLSLGSGPIQAMNADIEPADRFDPDGRVADADPGDYDGLILPGGTVNADRLRMDDDVRAFVRSTFDAGTPVAVISPRAVTR